MSRHLLDADAVIDYLRGIRSTVALLQTLNRQGHVPCTCDVVVAEVFSGLHAASRAGGAAFLASLDFLPTSSAAAQQAGEWRFDFARRGIALATTDCLIAATALDHGAVVVTGNLRHYPMAGLAVLPLPRVQRP